MQIILLRYHKIKTSNGGVTATIIAIVAGKKNNLFHTLDLYTNKPVMAIKKEEIAIVDFGKPSRKDIYIIYNNGTYLRRHDRSPYALNQIDTGTVSAFSDYLRLNILSQCPDEHRPALVDLFGKHPPVPYK